jgi:N-acetyl-anhydromuramyl-L-alanine amidase AmpD
VIGRTGWYTEATQVLSHVGRVGGTIEPSAVVVHTTDCMPGSMPAIVKSWSTTAGNGACAHFIIGRNPTAGVVQLISTWRNGNHAGGFPKHGFFKIESTDGTQYRTYPLIHPNTVSIGIELDCAGYLGRPYSVVGGPHWRHPDTKREVAAVDVDVDATGKGWHSLTLYQYNELGKLIDAIIPTLHLRATLERTNGLTVVPNGDYAGNGVPWADTRGSNVVVGHCTLDPTQKTDPGPFVMAWIAKRYG